MSKTAVQSRLRDLIRRLPPGRRRKREDYRAVFIETEVGRRILHDLARTCGYNRPSHAPGRSPEDTAFYDGMRNVFLYIQAQIGGESDPAEFLDEMQQRRGDYHQHQNGE